jgi:sugar phosphate isomerase/epimerase
MAWKYAVFTVMCPECDLEQTAAMAASLGFDGLEWRVTKRSPEPIAKINYWSGNRSTVDVEAIETDLPRAKAIADAHGLAMPVLGTYMSCRDHAVVEKVMAAAAAIGTRVMRVGPPGYDGSRSYPDLFAEAVKDFAVVGKLAEKYGVQACVEMHMNNITPSAGLAHRLVSNFDPKHIGVIFDPGNMVVEGYEQYQMGLELLGPYLKHVHAKNCAWFQTGEENGVAKWESRMVATKKGQTDWPKVMAALQKVGYQGWFSFEDFSEGDTKQKLQEALAYLKGIGAAL